MNAAADSISDPKLPLVDVDAPSVVEAWVAEHPTNDFDPAAEPAPVTPPIPLDTDGDSPDPVVPAPDTADVPEVPATEATAPATDKPADPVAPVVAAEPAKPVEPAKPTYAPDEKFALAEGVEWTRDQVVTALKERVDLLPAKQQAEVFSKVFRMDAAKAEEVWAPIVNRLAAEPETRALVASYFDDADKKAYIDSCSAYYDAEVGPIAPPVAPPVAALDPVVRKQIDELTKFKADRDQEIALSRYNNEMAQVAARYPFVMADPRLLEELRDTARYLYAQDQSKGILDALALKAPLYDAVAIALAQQATPEPAAAPAAAAAALPTSGAAAQPSRRNQNRAPKFDSTDDATAAWLEQHPGDFKE